MALDKLRKPLKAAAYDPADYGLGADEQVRVDPALDDPVLDAALVATRADDWKPALAALADAGADWGKRGIYVDALATVAARNPRQRWLDHWRAEVPSSPDAAVVHAQSLLVKAWDWRGAGTASVMFPEILRTCADETLKAAEMAPRDPTPWTILATAARGLLWPSQQFDRIWQELMTRDPLNRRAHIQALLYWQPTAFGSPWHTKAFVADAAARAPRSALAFELRLSDQIEIWSPRSRAMAQSVYFRYGVGRRALHEALDDYWTEGGAVTRGGGLALLDNNWLAWALTLANRWDDACKAWLAIGGRRSESAQWLYVPKADYLFYGIRREAFVMSSLKPNQSKQPHQPTS
jgi:hypothetical protein